MLALPDPDSLGARRIADALAWLEAEKFVSLTREAGAPPAIKLNSALGDGRAYYRPRSRWVTLPLGFWQEQWITELSGSGTALLLALLDLQGGRSEPQFVTAERRVRYGLSEDTWRRATAELVDKDLLKVGRTIESRDFEARRVRNTYWIDESRLEVPPSGS